MKVYVHVFEKRGSLKKVLNRTYELRDYSDYLMVSELRKVMWKVYLRGWARAGCCREGITRRLRPPI